MENLQQGLWLSLAYRRGNWGIVDKLTHPWSQEVVDSLFWGLRTNLDHGNKLNPILIIDWALILHHILKFDPDSRPTHNTCPRWDSDPIPDCKLNSRLSHYFGFNQKTECCFKLGPDSNLILSHDLDPVAYWSLILVIDWVRILVPYWLMILVPYWDLALASDGAHNGAFNLELHL